MSLETLDVGQANELKLAFRRNGWTNEEIKKLCEGDVLTNVHKFVFEKKEIKLSREFLIDCDAAPFVPEGWRVEEHKNGGQMKWDPSRVTLYLSDNQKGNKHIEGNNLRKELENLPVQNANVLDFLLKHVELIPEAWKRDERGNTCCIFFWGSVYRDSYGCFCVRCLYWDVSVWRWSYRWLEGYWGSEGPATVSAS